MANDPLFSLVYSLSGQKELTPLRRFLRHFDWVLFLDVMFLCLVGLLMVYSASLRFSHSGAFIGKQLAAFAGGMVALFIFATLNYQIFSQHLKMVLGISLSLLLMVLLLGNQYRGTKAWFSIGPFSFQPAELSKLLAVLVLAGWCDRHSRELGNLKTLLTPFLIVLGHIGLIMLQPDFGSTLVYFPILLAILFTAGANVFHLMIILLYGLIAGSVLLLHTYLSLSPAFLEAHPFWEYIYSGMRLGKEFLIIQLIFAAVFAFAYWFLREMRFRIYWIFFLSTYDHIFIGWFSSSIYANSIKNYQRKRLIAFFNPSIDPMGSGYHVIQSMVTLGSGKIFGKGLFSSTQGRLGFLPEQHTDFIFSILGEELGFVASGTVIILYLILIWRAFAIAGNARDRFGSLIAVGIGTMFAFYAILNIAMVMGMAPVAGLPLPFLSYGGSAMFSSLMAVGVLLSVSARRYTY